MNGVGRVAIQSAEWAAFAEVHVGVERLPGIGREVVFALSADETAERMPGGGLLYEDAVRVAVGLAAELVEGGRRGLTRTTVTVTALRTTTADSSILVVMQATCEAFFNAVGERPRREPAIDRATRTWVVPLG